MAYIHDFEREDTKHRRMSGAPTSNYDAWDNPTVTASNDSQKSFFEAHIKQYTELISFFRWHPDLFLDMIRPEKGGINLHFDQRVYLRCICRFASVYGVFPRGWRKNMGRSNFYVYYSCSLSRSNNGDDCSNKG
jgi:ribonucleoside-diphosphate reductase alpha chain|nr:MAG TPA: Terminase large subunit [Caudoviricetes sp.]